MTTSALLPIFAATALAVTLKAASNATATTALHQDRTKFARTLTSAKKLVTSVPSAVTICPARSAALVLTVTLLHQTVATVKVITAAANRCAE